MNMNTIIFRKKTPEFIVLRIMNDLFILNMSFQSSD